MVDNKSWLAKPLPFGLLLLIAVSVTVLYTYIEQIMCYCIN